MFGDTILIVVDLDADADPLAGAEGISVVIQELLFFKCEEKLCNDNKWAYSKLADYWLYVKRV